MNLRYRKTYTANTTKLSRYKNTDYYVTNLFSGNIRFVPVTSGIHDKTRGGSCGHARIGSISV